MGEEMGFFFKYRARRDKFVCQNQCVSDIVCHDAVLARVLYPPSPVSPVMTLRARELENRECPVGYPSWNGVLSSGVCDCGFTCTSL